MTERILPSTGHMVAYDENSSVQDRMIIARQAKLRQLVSQFGPRAAAFVIADYGCGPGKSAIDAVRPSVEAYLALRPQGPVVVRHCDQPENDWNGLLALVHGPDGYMVSGRNVRVETSVGSFYSVMAAPGSVSLASCFAASHWLSRALHVHSPGAMLFSDLPEPAWAAMRALARQDWTTFLRCRARELSAGGFLITSTLGSFPDPSEPNGTFSSGRRLYRAMHHVAQGMVDDALLSQSALDEFIFPVWFPGAADLDAPLEDHSDLAAMFEKVETEVTSIPDNWRDVFAHAAQDPARYAALYAGYARGFAESTLRLHLFARSKASAEPVDRLLSTFFRRLHALYEASPGEHASETVIATQVLRRTDAP